MLNLCNKDHDAIVFEGRNCPLCAEITDRKELEETVMKLEDEIKDLEEAR